MTLDDVLTFVVTSNVDDVVIRAMVERLGGHASEISVIRYNGVTSTRFILSTYRKDSSWEIATASASRRQIVISIYATVAECLGTDAVVEATKKMVEDGWTLPPSTSCRRLSPT